MRDRSATNSSVKQQRKFSFFSLTPISYTNDGEKSPTRWLVTLVPIWWWCFTRPRTADDGLVAHEVMTDLRVGTPTRFSTSVFAVAGLEQRWEEAT